MKHIYHGHRPPEQKLFLYPYKAASQSAQNLAEALDIPRIKHEGSKFKGSAKKTVINWGSSELPSEVMKCTVLNKPNSVTFVTNKLEFFKHQSSFESALPRLIPWTESKQEAQDWLTKGYTVVVRKLLTSHSGNGIVIVQEGGALPDAPLYTQYVPKSQEFRIHFMKGEVIDKQKKIRDPAKEPMDWKVRSHSNGFIFIREGVEVPSDVLEQSRRSFTASNLDFGAVDVIWNNKYQKAYVLEINSAVGLEGQTIESYANAFKKQLGFYD